MTQSALDRPAGRTGLRVPRATARHAHAEPASIGIRCRHRLILFGVAGALYVFDLVTKIAVVAMLQAGVPVELGASGVSLRLIRNPGAAFGVGVDLTWLFTAITVLVVVAILRAVGRLASLRWALALGLLLGGALGNLTDRLVRSPGLLRGHVIDFVEIPGWPIFNVADLSICLAGLLMVALAIRNVPIDGGRRRA